MVSKANYQNRELILGTQVYEEEAEGTEVALTLEEGRRRLEVRLVRWWLRIGWYIERRIPMSPATSKMVRQALGRGEALARSRTETDMALASTANYHGGGDPARFPGSA